MKARGLEFVFVWEIEKVVVGSIWRAVGGLPRCTWRFSIWPIWTWNTFSI